MEEINTVVSSPVVKPKSSFKIPLLIIFVIGMMALSSLVTYLILKSPVPVQTSVPVVQTSPSAIVQPTPTPDPTANWKMYTNTKYKYQINYPSDWDLSEAISQKEAKYSFKGQTLFSDELQAVYFCNPGNFQFCFKVSILPNSNSESLEVWAKLYKETDVGGDNLARLTNEKAKIDNQFAEKFDIFGFDHNDTLLGSLWEDNFYLVRFANSNPNDPSFKEHQKIYQQILSTFKFLE